MATYTNTDSKRWRVLSRLRDNIAAISVAGGAFFTVKSATVYAAQNLVLGADVPAAAVIPTSDRRVRALACGEDEHSMSVSVIGVLRIEPQDNGWRENIHRLMADILSAIRKDIQLGGLAVYCEPTEFEILDTEGSGNRVLAVCEVACTIVYRVAFSDPTV